MIFVSENKSPSYESNNEEEDEDCQNLPAILPRPGMGYFILDLFQVSSQDNPTVCFRDLAELSQFLILPQLPQKMKLPSKVVKVDSKIIISLPKI
jgi:hypothetical protein